MKRASPMHAGEPDQAVAVEIHGWWKHEQTAWCPFCWQGYAWELHVACVECDRPTCPLCIEHGDHEDHAGPRCPECAREEAPT
jgi:hypothetical protein